MISINFYGMERKKLKLWHGKWRKRRKAGDELSEMKQKYADRQQDAQKLAARVLRAESMLDDLGKEEMEKNDMARKVVEHQKTIDGLLDRLRAGDGSASYVTMPQLPASPRGQREEIIADGRPEDEVQPGRCAELYVARITRCKRRCAMQ
eukprot:GEMP01040769.1.p2 GENE.GEMP01040769.1~~GEMP01040769.1.p2  ORF type:complete len:150 (+),score=34.81 GEMP01040769.1:467-916(+)